jgi:hypothetical protein
MQRIVFIILATISFLFGSIVIYKLATQSKCNSFKYNVPSSATADEKVFFVDSTTEATSWLWDFGDGTENSTLQNPSHYYKKAGKYIVKLVINGKCEDFKDITIEPKPMTDLELAHIQGPTEAFIGQAIKFTEITENATAYEWLFGESGKVDAREKSPTYIFKTTGYKTIAVYVTSPKGRTSGTLTINVKEKDVAVSVPVANNAPADNSPKYTTQEKKNLFTNGFTAFITSTDDATRQKALEKFKPFICGADAPVYKNGKEAVGIILFCKDLQNKNKYCKVKSMNIDWNEGSDCLKAVHLEYKEK